jgi:hypothetical protein
MHENVVQRPVQEPSSASRPGTNAQNGAFMSDGEGAQNGARVRWLDSEPAHAHEPLTPPETRWGPGPGAYW